MEQQLENAHPSLPAYTQPRSQRSPALCSSFRPRHAQARVRTSLHSTTPFTPPPSPLRPERTSFVRISPAAPVHAPPPLLTLTAPVSGPCAPLPSVRPQTISASGAGAGAGAGAGGGDSDRRSSVDGVVQEGRSAPASGAAAGESPSVTPGETLWLGQVTRDGRFSHTEDSLSADRFNQTQQNILVTISILLSGKTPSNDACSCCDDSCSCHDEVETHNANQIITPHGRKQNRVIIMSLCPALLTSRLLQTRVLAGLEFRPDSAARRHRRPSLAGRRTHRGRLQTAEPHSVRVSILTGPGGGDN